jgi:hypothetical protein
MAGRGTDWPGTAWQGKTRQAWRDKARLDADWRGKTWQLLKGLFYVTNNSNTD